MTYQYFKGEKDKDFYVKSMQKYVDEKQELDKALEDMLAPYLNSGLRRILDICCGIGHLIYHLSSRFPMATFVGIDQTSYLIDEARKLCAGRSVKFFCHDVLDTHFIANEYAKFDVVICWKTLSWIPHYREMVPILFKFAKDVIFISSLFYDGDIDFTTQVREYQKESGEDGPNAYYNIYSYPRFVDYCHNFGAKNVEAIDFEMPIDLPKGDPNHMGTYTLKLENGKRLQMSGAVPMLWKIVKIELHRKETNP